MPLFQISSQTLQQAAFPKKRMRHFPLQGYTIVRVIGSVVVVGTIFAVFARFRHSDTIFILLPALLSLATVQPQRYKIKTFLNSTLRYLFFTICLTFIYYIIMVEGLVFIQQGVTSSIIIIASTIAWVILFEPARIYFQSLIERYFNIHSREMRKAVETFTATLREEIDIEQLCQHFLLLLQRTVQPSSVSLWIDISNTHQARSSTIKEIMVTDNDPLITYILRHPGSHEVDRLRLASPLLSAIKVDQAEILVPLINQGKLLGLLLLWPHLKGEAYTREERAMLNTLAIQVAPALNVAQMVYIQQIQQIKRERIEQELQTAQAIQRTFLPKNVPVLSGWQLTPYYQPAREVGGDFYDFLALANGLWGLVIGDVTGKGVPAALVMATVHTMLRSAVRNQASPREILAQVNELLVAEIPPGMFVTCFLAIFNPASGQLCYANAGHDLPYCRCFGRVTELWATGMPLGMMPETCYEEYETTLSEGESLFFYSDGLIEAHNSAREMFGLPRLQKVLAELADGAPLIENVLAELQRFTREEWEQEDDITLLTLHRMTA